MADKGLENPGGGFNIESTIDLGFGDNDLLKGLYDEESGSATGNPDEIEPIIEDADGKKEEKKEEKKEKDDSLQKFLLNDDDDDKKEEENNKGEKKEEKNNNGDGGDESSDISKQISALSKDLFKLGVFTSDGDDEGTEETIDNPEQFLEKFQSEKKKGAIEIVNNFIGQFGEDYQNAFDAIFVKGVDPREYFTTYNNIVGFAELDLTIESNQELVVRQALADQGFEQEDIATEIERLKNYGDLEAVSAKHHKVLIKKEAVKLQQKEREAAEALERKQLAKNEYIRNVQTIIADKLKNKEFDGIPINPKLANELHDFLLVDKYKTAAGETLTDFDRTILELKRPENHIMKVKVALLLKILEKDPTLSTIQKSGISKKTDRLFEEVSRLDKQRSSSEEVKPTSWFK